MDDRPVAVAVFARAPVPGQAKTRLLPCLGPQGTAELQTAFVLRAIRTALEARLGPVSLWCAPDCSHPVFRQCRESFGVPLFSQAEGDLGARMFHAFAVLCEQGPALLIGVDCPALTAERLRHAAQVLGEGRNAVFIPAEDGGYVMIGLQRPEPAIFGQMPWSRPELMEETRKRLNRLGWRWEEPTLLWDVDEPRDFARLRASGLMDEWFRDRES